jgi:hypothetical protein
MAFIKNLVGFLNGFRKLTIIFVVILVSTLMLVLQFIDSQTYGNILVASVPSYMAGNVAEWAVREAKDWIIEYKKEKNG